MIKKEYSTIFIAKHSETLENLFICTFKDKIWSMPVNFIKNRINIDQIQLPENKIVEGQIFQHYKGKRYMLLKNVYNLQTQSDFVIYQALYGDAIIWARPYVMFFDVINGIVPRFESV